MDVKVKSKKNINQIFHLSDIHIRALRRHDEYREVFSRVYDEIKKLKRGNSAVIITGDLVHEKDNLKPETIMIVSEFLETLKKICNTVILIPGNHDMIENNTDRLDTLTPIVRKIDIHYLRESGAYKFGNIIFGLSSLYDKKDVRRSDIPDFENCVYIALFHGMIDGCRTDDGWICKMNHSTRGKKISYFEGYDYVLLGDIHRMQFFGKHIAYAGSLIQQNRGENISGHGMIVWNLKRDSSKFIPIHNDYGYVDILAKENKIIKKEKIPSKPHIRLFVEQCTEDFIRKLKSVLEKKYKVQSFICVQRRSCTNEEKQIEGLIKPEDDIVILKKEIGNYDIDDQNLILKFHAMMKANIETNDFNVQYWKILKMKFSNIMIYGGDEICTIDFVKRTGITSIVGENAIGKSAIMKILIYGLFGKISAVASQYQMFNNFSGNKKSGFVIIDILYGSKKYRIERNVNRKRRGKQITFEAHSNFYELDGDSIKCRNGENQTQTKIDIEKFLCSSAKDFLITNIYANNMNCSILNMKDTDKIKMFNEFFKLDWYKKLSDNVKQNIKSWNINIARSETEIAGLKKNIGEITIDENIVELQKKLEKKKSLRNSVSDKIQKLISEIEDSRRQGKELQKNVRKIGIKDVKEAKKELKEIGNIEKVDESGIREEYLFVNSSIVRNVKPSKKELEDNKKEIIRKLGEKPDISQEKINELIGIQKYELSRLKHEIEEIAEIDVSEGKEAIEGMLKDFDNTGNLEIDFDTSRLEELRKLIETYTAKVHSCIKYFEELEDLGNGELSISVEMRDCVLEILNSENTEPLRQEYEKLCNAENHNKRLKEKRILEHKLKYLDFLQKKKKEKEFIETINRLTEQESYYVLCDKLKEIDELIQVHIENEKGLIKLGKIEKKLKQIEQYKRKIFLEEQIKMYRENLDYEKQINAIEQKEKERNDNKNKMHEQLVRLSESIKILESRITNLNRDINKKNKNLAELKKKEIKLEKLKQRYRIAKIYKELVDVNGIPMKLVKSKIEDMEQHINNYLKDFTKFKIEMFEDGGKICINVIKNNLKLGIMDISGYETFVLNIAIKSAFAKHSLTGKCSLLCIDEGLDAVDEKNWEKLGHLFDKLREPYDNILLITHIPDIRSFEDNSIQIARMEGGYSKIVG